MAGLAASMVVNGVGSAVTSIGTGLRSMAAPLLGPTSPEGKEVKSDEQKDQEEEDNFNKQYTMVCGRKWHQQEIIFFILLLIAILMMVLVMKTSFVPGFGALMVACVALFYILVSLYDYAFVKSLAESALKLKKVIRSARGQLKKQELFNHEASELNKSLDKENNSMHGQVKEMALNLGQLNHTLDGLNQLEDKLNGILGAHRDFAANSKCFEEEQRYFMKVLEVSRVEQQAHELTMKMRDEFEIADINRDGFLSTKPEFDYMARQLAEVGIEWPHDWDLNSDGRMSRMELNEFLDRILGSHFSAVAEERAKQAEMMVIQGRLDSAIQQGGRIPPGSSYLSASSRQDSKVAPASSSGSKDTSPRKR